MTVTVNDIVVAGLAAHKREAPEMTRLRAPLPGQWLRALRGALGRLVLTPAVATERPVEHGGSARIPVRCYEPDTPPVTATLVWAHGGSFVRGGLDWPEADGVARRCAALGMRVLSVDYALASARVKAPGPALDVAQVLEYARTTYGGLVGVGGASAGGHLAAYAALAHPGTADRLILLYPTLHRRQRDDPAVAELTASLPEGKRFGAGRIAEMYNFYLGREAAHATVVGELDREILATLPPTTIIAAERDDLRVSAEMFVEQLEEARVNVRYTVMPGALHGFANRPDESPDALEQTIGVMAAALRPE